MKSWSVANKFICRAIDTPDCDQVVFQNDLTHAREGTHKLLTETIKRLGFEDQFQFTEASTGSLTIINTLNGNKIIFREFKKEDKVKGLESYRHVWIDEADQMTESAFDKLNDTLRTFKDTTITFTFNPVSPFCWLKTRFVDETMQDRLKIDNPLNRHHKKKYYEDKNEIIPEGLWGNKEDRILIHWSTYLQNQFLSNEWFYERDKRYSNNLAKWKINEIGYFGSPEGLCFNNFRVESFDDEVLDHKNRGLDWGWTDPATVSETSFKNGKLYVCDEIYGSGKSNRVLANDIKNKGWDNLLIRADEAEPKSINDLNDFGCRLIKTNKKKTGVLVQQYKIMQDWEIIIHSRCKETIKEFYSHKWKKDKDGNSTDEPEDKYNHLIDAIRYSQEERLIVKFKPRTKKVTLY
jgi:phage terminase large subunit